MKTRTSERVYPSRHSAAFGIGMEGWLAPAKVSDYSDSGIGLEVRGVCHADLGDAIRVTDRGAHQTRSARVVRVSMEGRGGRKVTRLGCRWINSDEHPPVRVTAANHRRVPRKAA